MNTNEWIYAIICFVTIGFTLFVPKLSFKINKSNNDFDYRFPMLWLCLIAYIIVAIIFLTSMAMVLGM